MEHPYLKSILDQILTQLPKGLRPEEKADIYAYLGHELGLSHLLLPEVRPDQHHGANLPDKAPELYQDRADPKEYAPAFIGRVYAPWLGKGLARHHILHLDRPLYFAIDNWLRKKALPDWLDLPTKSELADRDLAKLGLKPGDTLPYPSYSSGLKDRMRLYNAARNRAKE